MKKICFIKPPYNTFMDELDAPFTLMYLASVAEECGWQAEILDMKNLKEPIPEAQVYAVTSSSPQWHNAVLLSDRLANQFPESISIVGGNHISADFKSIFDSRFNVGCVGEGELALSNILNYFKGFKEFVDQPQIKAMLCQGKPVKDLDSIPFPARHLVDWSRYKRGVYWGKDRLADAVSLISSRGCPFNCIFCGSKVVFGRQVRFRSVENVVDEIKQVIESMDVRGFCFRDDTFCLDKKRVFRLCEELEKLDVVWRCLSRVDTADDKMFEAMAKSGCKEVILGVESGSQKILDNLNKGTTVEQNLSAMKAVKRAGIQLKVGLIVGSPGETLDTVRDTMILLDRCPPDFWNVSCFTPFPGSDAWKYPERYGIKILTRDIKQYAMVGKGHRGNVVVETERMGKSDIECARDALIDLCLSLES